MNFQNFQENFNPQNPNRYQPLGISPNKCQAQQTHHNPHKQLLQPFYFHPQQQIQQSQQQHGTAAIGGFSNYIQQCPQNHAPVQCTSHFQPNHSFTDYLARQNYYQKTPMPPFEVEQYLLTGGELSSQSNNHNRRNTLTNEGARNIIRVTNEDLSRGHCTPMENYSSQNVSQNHQLHMNSKSSFLLSAGGGKNNNNELQVNQNVLNISATNDNNSLSMIMKERVGNQVLQTQSSNNYMTSSPFISKDTNLPSLYRGYCSNENENSLILLSNNSDNKLPIFPNNIGNYYACTQKQQQNHPTTNNQQQQYQQDTNTKQTSQQYQSQNHQYVAGGMPTTYTPCHAFQINPFQQIQKKEIFNQSIISAGCCESNSSNSTQQQLSNTSSVCVSDVSICQCTTCLQQQLIRLQQMILQQQLQAQALMQNREMLRQTMDTQSQQQQQQLQLPRIVAEGENIIDKATRNIKSVSIDLNKGIYKPEENDQKESFKMIQNQYQQFIEDQYINITASNIDSITQAITPSDDITPKESSSKAINKEKANNNIEEEFKNIDNNKQEIFANNMTEGTDEQNVYNNFQNKIFMDLPLGEIPEMKESFYDEQSRCITTTPSFPYLTAAQYQLSMLQLQSRGNQLQQQQLLQQVNNTYVNQYSNGNNVYTDVCDSNDANFDPIQNLNSNKGVDKLDEIGEIYEDTPLMSYYSIPNKTQAPILVVPHSQCQQNDNKINPIEPQKLDTQCSEQIVQGNCLEIKEQAQPILKDQQKIVIKQVKHKDNKRKSWISVSMDRRSPLIRKIQPVRMSNNQGGNKLKYQKRPVSTNLQTSVSSKSPDTFNQLSVQKQFTQRERLYGKEYIGGRNRSEYIINCILDSDRGVRGSGSVGTPKAIIYSRKQIDNKQQDNKQILLRNGKSPSSTLQNRIQQNLKIVTPKAQSNRTSTFKFASLFGGGSLERQQQPGRASVCLNADINKILVEENKQCRSARSIKNQKSFQAKFNTKQNNINSKKKTLNNKVAQSLTQSQIKQNINEQLNRIINQKTINNFSVKNKIVNNYNHNKFKKNLFEIKDLRAPIHQRNKNQTQNRISVMGGGRRGRGLETTTSSIKNNKLQHTTTVSSIEKEPLSFSKQKFGHRFSSISNRSINHYPDRLSQHRNNKKINEPIIKSQQLNTPDVIKTPVQCVTQANSRSNSRKTERYNHPVAVSIAILDAKLKNSLKKQQSLQNSNTKVVKQFEECELPAVATSQSSTSQQQQNPFNNMMSQRISLLLNSKTKSTDTYDSYATTTAVLQIHKSIQPPISADKAPYTGPAEQSTPQLEIYETRGPSGGHNNDSILHTYQNEYENSLKKSTDPLEYQQATFQNNNNNNGNNRMNSDYEDIKRKLNQYLHKKSSTFSSTAGGGSTSSNNNLFTSGGGAAANQIQDFVVTAGNKHQQQAAHQQIQKEGGGGDFSTILNQLDSLMDHRHSRQSQIKTISSFNSTHQQYLANSDVKGDACCENLINSFVGQYEEDDNNNCCGLKNNKEPNKNVIIKKEIKACLPNSIFFSNLRKDQLKGGEQNNQLRLKQQNKPVQKQQTQKDMIQQFDLEKYEQQLLLMEYEQLSLNHMAISSSNDDGCGGGFSSRFSLPGQVQSTRNAGRGHLDFFANNDEQGFSQYSKRQTMDSAKFSNVCMDEVQKNRTLNNGRGEQMIQQARPAAVTNNHIAKNSRVLQLNEEDKESLKRRVKEHRQNNESKRLSNVFN